MSPRKTNRIILAAMAFLFVLFMVVFEKIKYNRTVATVHEHADVIRDALWNLDSQGPVTYLKMAARHYNHETVKVFAANQEKAFLTINGPPKNTMEKILIKLRLIPRIQIPADVTKNNRKIGLIEVVHLHDTIYIYTYLLIVIGLMILAAKYFVETTHAKNILEDTVVERTRELQASKERLDLALLGADEGIWDWNIKNNVLHFDSRYYTISGYDPDEFPATFGEWEKRVHPDDILKTKSKIEQYLSGKLHKYNVEFRFLHKDGSYMWIQGRGKLVARNENGEPVRLVGTHSDITERKKIEQSLLFTQFSFDKAAIGIYYIRSDAGISTVNEHAAKILGYTIEELSEKAIYEIDPDVDSENWKMIWQSLLDNKLDIFETTHIHKNGKEIPVEITSNLIEYNGEQFSIAFVQDISERKQARETMRHNYFQLKTIYESLPVIIWSLDKNGVFTLSEGRELESLGFSPGQVVGRSCFDMYKDNAVILDHIKEGLAGESCEYDSEVAGSFYHTILTPFYDENKNIAGLNGLTINITEKKKIEKEIRTLQNYLSNIIDSMPSQIMGVDTQGRVTQWNKTTEKITGISAGDAREKSIFDLLSRMESEKDKIVQSIETGQVIQEQKKPIKRKDSMAYEDVTIYPLTANGVKGAVIRIDDVTEKVRLEEMMIQSEKMLSVGGLAAGMAHEINNPLAGMIQSANVMKSRLSDFSIPANLKTAEDVGIPMEAIKTYMEKRNILRMVEAINVSGRRVAEIVDNMLSFARKTDTRVSTHHPGELLDRILDLAVTDYDLKKQYDFKTIKIIKEYENDLPMIPCEGAKIQQVLLNILRNGAQAMQSGILDGNKEPCFTLKLSVEKESRMVKIEIKDNGPGMDKKTRSRIFEPFFTTKPPGVGTGLGLSVSYFIITENHYGSMDVESAPGKGANFIIRLPLEPMERPAGSLS